jgi:hypothetical protein
MGKFVTGPAITTSSSSPAFDCRKTAVCLGGLAAAAIASIAIVNPPLAVALVAEHSIVERSQVALVAAGTLLTMREAWRSVRRGRQIPLEIAIVAPLVMACVTELDLDQWLFGSKFIAKRFFADENYPVIARAAAMLVIVGVPVGIGVWLLTRWQTLRDDVTSAVRAPWGQTLAFGVILYGRAAGASNRQDPVEPPSPARGKRRADRGVDHLHCACDAIRSRRTASPCGSAEPVHRLACAHAARQNAVGRRKTARPKGVLRLV